MSALVLLALSAAFDTADRNVLDVLSKRVGIHQYEHDLFRSLVDISDIKRQLRGPVALKGSAIDPKEFVV